MPQIESPREPACSGACMLYLKPDTVKRCAGKTRRDGVGREAGGGIGMGNTCKSMAESCQCMAKTTTIL